MARQVLPIVGAIIGAYIGGPMGAQFGYAIGSLVGNAVDPERLQGPKIGDSGIQTSAEGIFRPVIFGTAACSGNITARGNRYIRQVEDQAGKGGPITESERVYWTFMVRIGEPIAAITRIWEDEKLVYDIRPESTIKPESAEYQSRFRFYNGAEDQPVDPDLEKIFGVGNTQTFPGTSYVVFPNYDLTDRRESIPNFRFEVASTIADSFTPSLIASNEIYSGAPDALSYSSHAEIGNPSERSNISISNEGLYVAAGSSNPPFLYIGKLNEDQTEYDPVSLPVDAPTGRVTTVAFHPTTKTLAISYLTGGSFESFNEARLVIYRYDTGVFVASDSDIGSASAAITFSANGTKLAWSQSLDSVSNGGRIYEFNTYNATLSDPSFLAYTGNQPHGPDKLNWSPGGTMLVEENYRVAVWSALTSPLTPLAFGPTETLTGAFWSPNSRYVYTIYNTVDKYELIPNPAYPAPGELPNALVYVSTPVQPPGIIAASSQTTDYKHLALGLANVTNASLFIYAVEDVTMDLIAVDDQPVTPVDSSQAIAWAPFSGVQQAKGASETLRSVVSALHRRTNQPLDKFDASELTDEVNGIVFAGEYTCADAIRGLLTPYFSDAPEYDKKIRYTKRGKAVTKVLTYEDLVDEPEEATRESAIEYPRALHMAFQNPIIGYAPAKATSQRESPDIRVVGEVSVQVPVVYNDVDDAAQTSDKLLKIAWAEAGGDVKLTVSDEHLDLVPSDCIGTSLRGIVRRLRINQIEDNPGTRTLTCKVDRQSAYRSKLTGIPLPPPMPPPPSIVGLSVFAFMDLPALTDFDDALIYYDAVSGSSPAWHGASVQRRGVDGSFVEVNSFTTGSRIGLLLERVADASEHYTDTTNYVRFRLTLPADIDSITEEQFLSEGGGFALENNDGSWELLQYRDSDQEDDTTYTLTTLHRGRLNTQTNSHAPGARIVFLPGVKPVAASVSQIGANLDHRAVSYGTSPETAIVYTNEYNANSQREWSVANLILEVSGTDIVATAVPRHRFGTEDNPIASINWQGYRFLVTDGVNVITQDSLAPSVAFDLSGWTFPVSVTVSQLNRITGPGPSVTESIE